MGEHRVYVFQMMCSYIHTDASDFMSKAPEVRIYLKAQCEIRPCCTLTTLEVTGVPVRVTSSQLTQYFQTRTRSGGDIGVQVTSKTPNGSALILCPSIRGSFMAPHSCCCCLRRIPSKHKAHSQLCMLLRVSGQL